MSDVIAIIPARGGSSGLPGKALTQVCGKALIDWSIRTALDCESVDRTAVTTDSSKICDHIVNTWHSDIADGRLTTIGRPGVLAEGTASLEPTIIHAAISLFCGSDDILMILQPTSPVRLVDDLDSAIELAYASVGNVVSVTTAQHCRKWTGDGPDKWHLENRQRVKEPELLENGSIYIVRFGDLLEANARFGTSRALYEMPPTRSWQIDEPLDIPIVEAFMRIEGIV